MVFMVPMFLVFASFILLCPIFIVVNHRMYWAKIKRVTVFLFEEEPLILIETTKMAKKYGDRIESAMEAKEPPPPDVTQLCRETFHKTAEYINGELVCTAEDYRLLENMNKATLNKYVEMKQITSNISKSIKDLNEKYENLQPYLEKIDQIEESVASLEQAAYKLDAYSKRLEAKFKQLEKR